MSVTDEDAGRGASRHALAPEPSSDRGVAAGVLLVGAVGGFGVMAVELAAVRLLAPWFGTSLPVWTNVIGVVLLALSLGYLLGARLSAGERPLLRLALVLLGSALLVAWLPALAHPVAEAFRPDDLPLSEAAPHFAWGSLAAALALFLPGAALLGAVGPLCVEVLQRATRVGAGTAGGRVLFASTAGSLLGCFATSYLLVPRLGVSTTFLTGGAALALAGLASLGLARAGRTAVVAGLLLALLGPGLGAALSRLRLPGLPDGTTRLAVEESPYQWLYVVEQQTADGPLRLLQVNEGVDSFQSVWRPEEGLLGEGFYYDLFALPAWWAGAREEWHAAVIGFGAGTTARVLNGASPPGVRVRVAGIELDPVAVALGERHMDLTPGPDLVVAAGLDGRAGLRLIEEPLDLVVLDAYANQVEIPPHLSTVELFREVREGLSPGGFLAVNVSGFGLDDPVVEALGATVAAAFGERALALHVPGGRNYVLFARRDAALPTPGSAAFLAAGPAEELARAASLEGAWRWLGPGDGPHLSDDDNPIDLLQLRSIREGRGRLLAPPPATGEGDLETLAAEHWEAGHPRLALAAADAGLRERPQHLRLAWVRGAALQALGAGEELASAARELRSATDALPAGDPARATWEPHAAGFARAADELLDSAQKRARSLRRARLAALVEGLLALALLAVLSLRATPGVQGRSSSPAAR